MNYALYLNSDFREMIYEKLKENSIEMEDYVWGLTEYKLRKILKIVSNRVEEFDLEEFISKLETQFKQTDGVRNKIVPLAWRVNFEIVYDELDNYLYNCKGWADNDRN